MMGRWDVCMAGRRHAVALIRRDRRRRRRKEGASASHLVGGEVSGDEAERRAAELHRDRDAALALREHLRRRRAACMGATNREARWGLGPGAWGMGRGAWGVGRGAWSHAIRVEGGPVKAAILTHVLTRGAAERRDTKAEGRHLRARHLRDLAGVRWQVRGAVGRSGESGVSAAFESVGSSGSCHHPSRREMEEGDGRGSWKREMEVGDGRGRWKRGMEEGDGGGAGRSAVHTWWACDVRTKA